jgi:tRNA-specific adenosine deaminase 1
MYPPYLVGLLICPLDVSLSSPKGGDASTRYLASMQDPSMAALKDKTEWSPLSPGNTARGRDNYSLLGVLRTKPGRADSPPTRSHSCSDKIYSWSFLGFQGAIGSVHLEPLYISTIIIGGVTDTVQDTIREDCERAFWRRFDCKYMNAFDPRCGLT